MKILVFGRRHTVGRPKTLHAVCRRLSTSSDGYAFVVLMVALTVMLIALTTALPSVYHESQREKEDELIFRGNQYARAIYLFQRQFRRYPQSVDELIRTNNMRFLRQAYTDPMSPSGKWRFIHVGPNGALIDSLTMGLQQPQFVGAFGQGPRGPTPSSSIFGASQDQPSSQNVPNSQDTQGEKPKARPGCEVGKSESAIFSDNQVQGVLIAGVASCSDKNSIRVYNKKTKYEEWEFLGVGYQVLGFPGALQPQQPQLGGGTEPSQSGAPGIQTPPVTPLTDQPAPSQPKEPQEGQDTQPQP
jgi:type II secretory pathway pseudopilin PulG